MPRMHAGCRLVLSFVALVFACLGSKVLAAEQQAAMQIDAAYPGGNIILEKIDGDTVHIRQDLRDTRGWWFWWNFRVKDAPAQTYRFQFAGQSPIGVLGPAVSLDQGQTWSWLGADSVKGPSFSYSFPRDSAEVRFAFAVPYQQANLRRFFQRHSDASEAGLLSVDTLGTSRKGRQVPLLRIRDPQGDLKYRVLVTARHHACETMASYVLEGLLEALLSDSSQTRWLQRHCEIIAVPFADLDGVVDGDQGKNRQPRDHNRDYAGESIYPETGAIRSMAKNWTDAKLKVGLDLHCPWIRGRHNDVIYIVGSSDEAVKREQDVFAKILESVQSGPLVYDSKNNIPFGTAWNTANNFSQGKSFARWASQVDGVRLAATFEIPYASASQKPVTPDTARAFGKDLTTALANYLKRVTSIQSSSQQGIKELVPF